MTQLDWGGIKEILGLISLAGGIIYGSWRYVIKRMLKWGHKKIVESVVKEVMTDLGIDGRIEQSLDKYFKPNGGNSIYDKIEAISQNQIHFKEFVIRNEQMNRASMNTMQVPFFEADERGGVIYASPKLCDIMGRTESELLGSNWENCISEKDRIETINLWRWAIKNKATFKHTFEITTESGENRKISSKAYPIIRSDGTLTGMFGSMLDLHD